MFTHSTWLVVFFSSHFLFQWFWFLSIIEVSEFFLRATSITINKWLQKERKGLRLRVKPIKKKSLSRSSFGSQLCVPKKHQAKFSYELKSQEGRWGSHASHWYFLHYFLKSSRLCDPQIYLCFPITKYCTKAFFGLSVPQSQPIILPTSERTLLAYWKRFFFSSKV